MATKKKTPVAKPVAYRPALEGETFSAKGLLARFYPGDAYPIAKKVEVDPERSRGGQWICITCSVPLENQLQKDTHIDSSAPRKSAMVTLKGPPARHILAWRSFDSGELEVP